MVWTDPHTQALCDEMSRKLLTGSREDWGAESEILYQMLEALKKLGKVSPTLFMPLYIGIEHLLAPRLEKETAV